MDSLYPISSNPIPIPPTALTPSQPPTMVLRRAKEKDLKGLAHLLTESFHPPKGWLKWLFPLLRLSIYEDLRHRHRQLQDYYSCFLLATGDQLMGTVELSVRAVFPWLQIEKPTPYIANLAVKPYYRRQGVARQLLEQCEKTAKKWGFNHITLHVLENNFSARQLYFSSGYRLHSVESGLGSWIFNQPKRWLLEKDLTQIQE